MTTVATKTRKVWRLVLVFALMAVLSVIWQTGQALAAADQAQGAPVDVQNGGDDGKGDDNARLRYRGVVVSITEGDTEDVWVVGDKSFTVNAATELDQEEGPLEVGACVKVTVLKAAPAVAVEVDSEPQHDCVGDKPGGDDDDDGNDGSDDHSQGVTVHFGLLESRPTGDDLTVAPWVIGGKSYSVTQGTELDTKHGSLEVGVCLRVKALKSAPGVATHIKSQEGYQCSGRNDDDDDAEGEFYGVVMTMPVNSLLGDWIIGGKTIVVSNTTELDPNGGAFVPGVTVKVEFITTLEDVNIAREIKIVYKHDDDDDDDDKYGDRPGKEGKVFGLLVSRSTDTLPSVWNVGGISYTVDAKTKLYQNDDYQIGERLRVEYVVNDDDSRRATKIKETDANSDVSHPSHNKLVGFVKTKPDGFVWVWSIDGVEFVTGNGTKFKENDGVLTVGAYVSVEYIIVNNVRKVLEMEVQVPPGTGDDENVGEVQLGDDRALGVNAAHATLSVNGVTYGLTSATMVLENSGDLKNGAQVYVNSYTNAAGQQMATLIRTVNSKTYIPLAQR